MERQATSDIVPCAVFDAVVFVQAVLSSTGPAYAALLACAEGKAVLHSCDAVLEEVRNVLGRPFVRKHFPADWNERIERVLDLFGRTATVVENPPAAFRLPRDPKDETYINLAISVGAKYLVSRDRDLLDLMTDESPEASAFRQQYPNLTVLDPVSFLQALAG